MRMGLSMNSRKNRRISGDACRTEAGAGSVANIVASLPDEMGQGIYYWEPICVPKDGEGGWSENMGLLEEKGTIMEGIRSFLFTRNDACPEKPAKIYEPEPMTVVKDEACYLPEMLPVLLYDGMVEQRRVNWNEVPDTRVTGRI